eukprot:CAMPEP_0203906208 /NCGR_PEP_ID=MMETSP0359-20131031/47863_1 /ASSEMBLY_ACC=CAM_ASM_000338 /TAXON_ID=268821 /ORGANISM="Scrippsiella Hangoei, Strain SHTV-5" /LENGTH=48 /DNA_ID= /DNA_START= /DNA_END= /DNA_ORIENTATION=
MSQLGARFHEEHAAMSGKVQLEALLHCKNVNRRCGIGRGQSPMPNESS